ncbi:hypothetical protein HYX13_04955 [Candidatus Woesearchaeota archaeon]|nr:hypothetical protein [Candidatus Woesearchaeota archaeon]
MALKIVDNEKVEMKKVDEFITALAGVEARCEEIKDFLVSLRKPRMVILDHGVALFERKFDLLKENFALAKRDGRRALRTVKKALVSR